MSAPGTADLTQDSLLNGRVRLAQPRARGLRAGLDAVFLAASIPAEPGDAVLEAGCGSGAGFLCLAVRIPGLRVTALEREPALAQLAAQNAAANALAARILTGDVADPAPARDLGPIRHGFANPPYWPGGSAPPEALRAAATHERGAGLVAWARFFAAILAPRGSLTLILPAARFDAGAEALRGAGFGSLALLPLSPRAGAPAKRVLLRGLRGGRGPASLAAPFTLHEADGRFTPAAEAVLRDGAALPF